MVYAPTRAANVERTVFIAATKNGRITSKPGASHLTVQAVGHPKRVYVSVTAGACPSSS